MSKLPSTPLGHTRAVVLGGGLAGMLAAAALRHAVDQIDIIEPHALPDQVAPRTGLPQARHAHSLMEGGAEAIDQLLPGTLELLCAAGANRIPLPTGMVAFSPEGWYRRWLRESHYVIAASRDLIDHTVRQQTLKHPGITVHTGHRAVALVGSRRKVTGVRVEDPAHHTRVIPADLIIDATGRASRTPLWLSDLGIPRIKHDKVDSGLAYASRTFQAPSPTKGWPIVTVQADARTEPGQAITILPIENDQWLVSLSGTRSGQPTSNPDDFLPFARGLRHPVAGELLAHARPISDVALTHSTANSRYYYERASAWPDGLIVLGDAVAAFNPVYGQGMSTAALGALALRTAVQQHGAQATGLARRVQRAIARPVNTAWALAVGQDIHFPCTTGKTPNAADRIVQAYSRRLSYTATGNLHAAIALTDVITLRTSPARLFRPDVVLAALLGPGRPQLTGPQFSASERHALPHAEGDRAD
ncbi:NAD(P)/FAD-dependent oxidoreductase [Streptomyces sp. NBC_01304]|uniref:NAD(P)/FAD-dependent oxidoreductase n=1 Tax=Streptomyces sp. NBC_01304 TaxID=2903818 RepID=UPI002E1162A5|nr:FAD-dependent monooxygenase [Streptomyces sp. NBC_01304]